MDFSHVNLEYLIRARDLATQNPDACAPLLDVPDPLASRLARVSPEALALITDFKPPLVAPRLESWWWDQLLRALTDGEPGELPAILEHAALLTDDENDTLRRRNGA